MTHTHERVRRAPHTPTRQARLHVLSEGVVAGYIHDLSTRAAAGAAPAAHRRADHAPAPGARRRVIAA
jgi:hypothetical protein